MSYKMYIHISKFLISLILSTLYLLKLQKFCKITLLIEKVYFSYLILIIVILRINYLNNQ